MRRVPSPTLLLAAAVFLTAAKRLPPGEELLQKSIGSLGGASKYERLETLAYEFVEKRAGDRGDVLVTGRHAVKLHDGQGLRVRTEGRSPGGLMEVALVTSSGAWAWRGGVPVTDAVELERIREDALRGVFYLLLPHNLKEAGWPVRYAGMGYLQGKLSQRLEVEPRPAGSLPSVGNFTVWLDSGTQRPEGVTFGPADKPEGPTFRIGRYETVRGLSLPLDRSEVASDGRKTSVFSILNLDVNSFVDDALFDPARGPLGEAKN